MRAYFFGNMYLSPIQQGIQALHVVGDMSVKYHDDEFGNDYFRWADFHKTVVLLNGGMASNLREIIAHFEHDDNPFSWDYFQESDDALDGALTCVGIILPERIYENAKLIRTGEIVGDLDDQGFSKWEQELYTILNSHRLA